MTSTAGVLAGDARVVTSANRPARAVRRVLVGTAVTDLLVLSASVTAAWQLRVLLNSVLAPLQVQESSASAPWIVLTWLVVLALRGGYSRRHFAVGSEEFRIVLTAALMSAGLVGLFCYSIRLDLSRAFLLLTFAIGTPLLLVERYVVRRLVRRARTHGRLVHRVLAVGGPSGIGELVEVLDREPAAGYRVVGAAVPGGVADDDVLFPVPVLGGVDDVRGLCDELEVDTVLVTRGGYATAQELRRIAWDLEGSCVDLVVSPSLTDVAGPRIHMRPVAGLPLLHVEQPQAGEAGGVPKRLFDIAVAGTALVLASPLLLVLAVLVKLHDGGPVLFRQARIGRTGQAFGMLKLRSMVVGAEERLDDVRHLNDSDGVLFKLRDDPRTTPVGRFLRRYSLDELPQLVNVLTGEMSLVGPRPPLPSEVERYGLDVHRRLLVRPGLTGLWQVSGRSGLGWEESVRLDLYYVDNWSMTSDLVIIGRTLRAVLRADGAY